MFSEHLQTYAQKKYLGRLPYLEPLKEKIEEEMMGCTPDEQVLMKFLYGTMPLRDAGEYEFSVFLGFVRHSLLVYTTMEWCREIPEDIFLHHILYYRVNTENIEDCRSFFYDQLKDRIKGLSITEAVLEINYWCAENGTYESSDNRTISPMTLYRSGKGRCGEESTFAVTAFRSVGIPARQVYTPRWAHCDDNHAWVEVYADGKWQFLGACEPEAILNKGWFSNASSRALLIHTRTFSDYSLDSDLECVGKENLLVYYNGTRTYAKTKTYEILILDEHKIPQKEATVFIEILNMAEYCPVATLITNEKGIVSITIGMGDIHVRAVKGSKRKELWTSTKDTDRLEMVFDGEETEEEIWIPADVTAPKDYPMHPVTLTKEQKDRNRNRIQTSNEMRESRIHSYYKEAEALYYPEAEEMLKLSAGNFEEIMSFLKKDENPDRFRMLSCLSAKDYKDAKAEILEKHLETAGKYRSQWQDKGELDIYGQYILCPRIHLEELTDYSGVIETHFSQAEKEAFKKKPLLVWDYIKTHIKYNSELDYSTICSTPAGSLKLGYANPLSQRILFAAICRTLGIPARVNVINLEAEYYDNGSFYAVSAENEKKQSSAKETVILHTEKDSWWTYYQTWTIGRLQDNRFMTLDYTDVKFSGHQLTLALEPGTYRIITSARMPGGDQHSSSYVFRLNPGEQKDISMSLREGNLEDMLVSNTLDDFEAEFSHGEKTEPVMISSVVKGRSNILAFLSEGEEPTEHVLNEMLDQKDTLKTLDAQIIFFLRSRDSLKNKTLQKVLNEIPAIRIGYMNFDDGIEPLARRMYVDPDKLPLLIVTNPGLTAVYGCSGYNVGSVDLMAKLLVLLAAK
ncbi:transglutaminase-like domain-containing protein [Clostridium sp. HBUAS56010]|uniref:transglutaminase-like domain-containing protein n=1 Tax=Clostridium sp. HBUAS56010 TaxID=2571127 RepID=UPI0011778D3F|nr:transglutaminase-like domain-containing protein [Clostridium sp. HBUAS56010]